MWDFYLKYKNASGKTHKRTKIHQKEEDKNMLNFEKFKDVTITLISEYLPDELNAEVTSCAIDKINTKKDGIKIKSGTTTMLIDANNIYANYCMTGNIGMTLKITAENIVKQLDIITKRTVTIEPENIKANIVFQLINKEQNKEMLKNTPHRTWNDLAVIYRHMINEKNNQGQIESMIITNELMQSIELSEKEMFELAADNTKRIMKPNIKGISQIIPNVTNNMLVISNEMYFLGATSILYTDIMDKIATRLDSDLYIIPSSIHETIAIPDNAIDGIITPEELSVMIKITNEEEINPEERLSNNLYHYNKNLKTITIVNTSDKNII